MAERSSEYTRAEEEGNGASGGDPAPNDSLLGNKDSGVVMPSQKYELKQKGEKDVEMVKARTPFKTRVCLAVLLFIVIALTIVTVLLAVQSSKASQFGAWTIDELLDYSFDTVAIDLRSFIEVQRQRVESSNGADADTQPDLNLCLTHACVEEAERINSNLNPEINPCENFYEFACGGWEKRTRAPEYASRSISAIEQVTSDNTDFFRAQLEKPVNHEASTAAQKARILYERCYDTFQIDKLGLTQVKQLIDDLGGFHDDLNADYEEFDLTERIIQLRTVGSNALFSDTFEFHEEIPKKLLLAIAPPASPLLIVNRTGTEQIYKLMGNLFHDIWADLFLPGQPISSAVYYQTYNVMGSIKEMINYHQYTSPYPEIFNDTLGSISTLNALCPKINWTRLSLEMTGDSDQQVLILNKDFFISLNSFLTNMNPRLLDNAMKFTFVIENLELFPYKYRQSQEIWLNRETFGMTFYAPEPRWRFCTNHLKVLMPEMLASWFIREYMDNQLESRNDVSDMIERVRTEYIDVLNSTSLLDKRTRDYAIAKIQAMETQVAFPDYLRNMTFLDELYKDVIADDRLSFFENLVKTKQKIGLHAETLKMTGQDIDDMWLDYSFVVNGFYSANLNRFTILSGILQGTFYGYDRPKYLNYGFMGFTIGHEFTHGFDDTGRHYDIDGTVKSWWSPESENNFNQVKTCFVDQYDAFHVTTNSVNKTVKMNGNLTLDENLADNGAIEVAYMAYENWLLEHGSEKLIPSLHFSSWQELFFVNLAQGWCAEHTYSGLSLLMYSFEHSQKNARVNGFLMNSPLFSEAFNCPINSPMNPEKKCTLW